MQRRYKSDPATFAARQSENSKQMAIYALSDNFRNRGATGIGSSRPFLFPQMCGIIFYSANRCKSRTA